MQSHVENAAINRDESQPVKEEAYMKIDTGMLEKLLVCFSPGHVQEVAFR